MNIARLTEFDSVATGFDFENATTIDNRPAKPREERLATSSNLTRWRCRLPVLAPDEERRLVIRYKTGDGAAGNELANRFHRLVLAEAVRYRGLIREGLQECDLIAAGMAAFAEALAKYDPRRNSRLGSLAMSLIKWRIKDCVRDWRRRGQAGATRADRHLLSHNDDTAEQVVGAVGCSLRDAEAAIARFKMYRHGHEQYVEDPAVEDDDAAPATPSIRARTRGPDPIDRAADEDDRRALRRLNEIGRRAYALELVAHDHARIAAWAEPKQYLYPRAVLRARAEAEQRRQERSWKLLSASVSQLARLRKQGSGRPARRAPEWWQWQRTSHAAFHAEVRANVYQKEDQRALEDARARHGLQRKPRASPRNRIRKETIRVWHQEHGPLLAAE